MRYQHETFSEKDNYARLVGFDKGIEAMEQRQDAARENAAQCYLCGFRFGFTGRHHCR